MKNEFVKFDNKRTTYVAVDTEFEYFFLKKRIFARSINNQLTNTKAELKMAIYTNEHLTDLLNDEYEKARKLEQELQKTRDQLEKAEMVIEFYGDPENWMKKGKDCWVQSSPKEHGDKEAIRNYEHPNIKFQGEFVIGSVSVGGKRARQYFKDKQGEG